MYFLFPFLFLCFSLSSSTSTSISTSTSSVFSDFQALLSLKLSFDPHRTHPRLATWDPNAPTSLCSWTGVECLHSRVVSLDLTNFNLSGSVSPALASLDRLTHLSLAGNNLSGSIVIANLTSLKYLNISNNQLSSGIVDWAFSSLPSLEVLDAYDNNFTSYLPPWIPSSTKIRYLDLGGNFFFGAIPPNYGSLMDLEYLSLAGNDLSGIIPKELGDLISLRELYLGYYNVYEGGIPREFGKLENLVHLDLSNSELKGPIPRELGYLTRLDTLYLHINRLSGSIPRELGNLTNLVNLDLSINALTGEIPSEFVNLKNLQIFNLFMNKLHGSVPEYIADFPNLNILGLWKNNFTGTIPSNLGANGKLQTLDLSSNKLTGTIPPNLCPSNNLQVLILLNNFLFGPIPNSLGDCLSLTRVRLGNNFLNGSVPNGFIYLPQLKLLELPNNDLSGNLPENEGRGDSLNPTQLDQLDLSDNQFSGGLPASMANFSSAQFLFLAGNRFTGPVPDSVGQLVQVIKLDLSRNNLSGTIPPEIGNCTHLTYLDLSQNNLSGSIPPEISSIRILNYLNLSRNHLNGSLPVPIGSMRSLTNADFSFNNLSGELPKTGQFSVFNASSFAGNPMLCGSVMNNPCNFTTGQVSGHKSSGEFKLVFALALLAFSLIFAAAAVLKAKSLKRSSDSWKMTAFQKVDYTVSDILECMKDGNVIGRGGAGIVYHGKMPNGSEIAVKKLLGFESKSSKHDHGFKAEIETLGNIRHRYIVRLQAFCSNKHTNLLVYEYMRNGSLGEALHGKKLGGFLGWNLRYKIAIEAAKGLSYLHHDCSPLIVHRDVKSNNILLNSNFEAHVADFGLAKYLNDGAASQCMSAIAGSYGYIAPEYAYTLRVDEKSDVYSFGVVLLELVTGRRPVGDFGEGVDIVQWSKQETGFRKESVGVVMDSRLGAVPQDEAMHMFFIAMLCTQENSVERPTMREVVQMLCEYPYHATGYQSSSSSLLLKSKPNNCSTKKDKDKECVKNTRDDLVV